MKNYFGSVTRIAGIIFLAAGFSVQVLAQNAAQAPSVDKTTGTAVKSEAAAAPVLGSRLFVLKHLKAQDALGAIQKILSDKGRVEQFDLPGRPATSVFVQDAPDRLDAIEKLLASLDAPLPSVNVTINYSNAPLLDVLRSLSEDTKINIIAGKDVSGSVTVHLVDVPLEKALDAILLSNGYTYITGDNLLRIIPLSEVPKKEEKPPELLTQVIDLHYVNGEDLKAPLEKLLSKEGMIQVFSQTSTTVANAKARANIIIVKDTQEVLKNISDVIRSLDKESPQILIEAKFLSIELGTTDQRGIDWAINVALSGSKVPVTFPFYNGSNDGRIIPLASESTDTTTTTDATSTRYLFPASSSGDFSFGALDAQSTKAVLNLLQQENKTKVISSPRVSAMNGEEAMINVGQNFPIPMYQTSSETGTQYISGYQEIKIGIILKVTPNLIGGNRILLNLHPEISAIDGYVGPNNERPITATKEVTTSVSVMDGGTIIIGGLIKDEETLYESHVPFLGKVPVLGSVFSNKNKKMSKTELVIFLTPHIISKDKEMLTYAPEQQSIEGR